MQPSLSQVNVSWKYHSTLMTPPFANTVIFPNSGSNFGSLIGHRVDSSSEFNISPITPLSFSSVEQAPFQVPPIFSGNRMLVYALFPPGTI